MRMPVFWTALLGVLAVTPFAAEAALRLYASYVAKPARLFRSDAQTGWSNSAESLDDADQCGRGSMEHQN